MGPEDFAARIGGDEFVIVVPCDGSMSQPGKLATRLIEAMSSPVVYDGHEIRTGVSVGIAATADGDKGAEEVLINADIALYEAKRRGRNRFEFFNRFAPLGSHQHAPDRRRDPQGPREQGIRRLGPAAI